MANWHPSDHFEDLIRRIDRTNVAAPFDDGMVTDALAQRDVLQLRYSLFSSVADAATGKAMGMPRQLRSDPTLTAVGQPTRSTSCLPLGLPPQRSQGPNGGTNRATIDGQERIPGTEPRP